LKQLLEKSAQTTAARDEAEKHLRATKWDVMKTTAAVAEARNEMSAYRRSFLLIAGTCVLAAGLMAISYLASDVERWMAMGGLIAVLLAIYCGSALS
jgi:hypothetical protein